MSAYDRPYESDEDADEERPVAPNWYDLDEDYPHQFDTREEERGER